MARNTTLIEAPVPLAVDPESESPGTDYAIFDLTNPRAVVNIVPEVLRKAILELGPEWRNLTERELHKKCDPDPRDARLRLAFWDEYSMAQDRGRQMKIGNVVRNICPIDYWEARVELEPEKLAFIVMPPKDYIVAMRALLDLGLHKFEEVLSLPIRDAKGKPDTRLIAEMVKIIQILDTRVKGAVVQKHRIDQRNLNLNVSPDSVVVGETLEELDAQIKKVQARLTSALAPGSQQDILVESVEVPGGGSQE